MTELAPSSGIDLQQAAKDHLWLHFTRMGGYGQADVPIIVRGDGCQLWDSNGKRYLDALAGLFSVNIGYGYGEEIGQAALEQMRELPFYTNWSYAHPRAIELAAEDIFDFTRPDLEARRHDHVFLAIHQEEPVVFIPHRHVPGAKPAVVKGTLRFFRLVPVSAHHLRPARFDLTV